MRVLILILLCLTLANSSLMNVKIVSPTVLAEDFVDYRIHNVDIIVILFRVPWKSSKLWISSLWINCNWNGTSC